MDCLPLPDQCSMVTTHMMMMMILTIIMFQSQSQCVTAESEPCCTEEITENCADMVDTCHWECREETTTTSTNASASTASTTTTASKGESFCVGGTDMYMRGFAVSEVRRNELYISVL